MRKVMCVVVAVFLLGIAQDTFANGGTAEPVSSPLIPPAGLKDPNTAMVLSAILPGLGQLYNDQMVYKGLFMGALEALGWVIIGGTDEEAVGIIIVSLNHVVSAFDAYVQASRVNQGLSLQITPKGPMLAFRHSF